MYDVRRGPGIVDSGLKYAKRNVVLYATAKARHASRSPSRYPSAEESGSWTLLSIKVNMAANASQIAKGDNSFGMEESLSDGRHYLTETRRL